MWLALLSLGTLGSPFAPASYVLLSLVWLLCLDRSVIARPAVLVIAWVALSAPLLMPREGPAASPYLLLLLAHLPAQALALVMPAMVLWRAGGRRPLAAQTTPQHRSLRRIASSPRRGSAA